jgi:hypothetical protein
MDGSDILASILGPDMFGLGAAPPANVLQGLAQPEAPQAPPTDPHPVMAAANQDAPPMPAPRKRRSLADIIGHIADGVAQAGGATPMYQHTLDAMQARDFAATKEQRDADAAGIKLATDRFALGDSHNARLGLVARGLKAIQAAGGDINTAFPTLAQQMQLDPETTQSIGHALATDPHALDGLIGATTDPKYDQSKYGGTVVYGKNKDGKLVAYQPSLGNDPARNILPDEIEPTDPFKAVDTGGAQVLVGTRSGNPIKVLPKTAKPDTILTTRTSRENNHETNQTALTIAGMPARSKDGSTPGGKTGDANVPTLLNNIESGFNDLHGMKALPGEGSAIEQVEGAFGRSALGQKIGEQAGTPAAQKRLEIMKNVSALQQAMLKSLPASATRTKFEQEMLARGLPDPSKMSLATAQTVIKQLRQSYAEAVATLNKSQTPVRTSRKPAASGGWSIVGVK